MPGERDALAQGTLALDALFHELLYAALPNAASLVYSGLPLDYDGKRELLYALGLMNEGENEAALIVRLADAMLRRNPAFDVAHLEREAWYYLRTSIDPTWQFDDGPPSTAAIFDYLDTVLRERLSTVRAVPRRAASDEGSREAHAELLRSLRDRDVNRL